MLGSRSFVVLEDSIFLYVFPLLIDLFFFFLSCMFFLNFRRFEEMNPVFRPFSCEISPFQTRKGSFQQGGGLSGLWRRFGSPVEATGPMRCSNTWQTEPHQGDAWWVPGSSGEA